MRAALEGLTDENGERHTKLIAVTVLTSTSEEALHRELLHREASCRHLHSLCEERGRRRPGRRVCSPLESPVIHEHCGAGFLTVTPGVRFAGGEEGRPGARHHAGEGKRAGQRLYRLGAGP